MTVQDTRLLILLPELTLGGLLRHACDVARQAGREGMPATIVSVRGARDVSEHLTGVDVRLLEAWNGAGQRQVLRWMKGADVLLLSSPQTALLAPALGEARSAVVGVHGSPGTNREWLGAERFEVLATAVGAPGGPQVLVPGQAYVDGVAREFGISTEQVSVLPNATPLPECPPSSLPGMGSVLAPMRLSDDKRWVLKAAAQLAMAGHVPLKVVGQGPHAAGFRAWLESLPGLSAEVIESGDFETYMREADVVVAVGLVALEAAVRGRRVAVAAKPGGGLAGALTPSSWATLQATNFAGLGLPEQPPAEVWATLGQMTTADLEGVVERVARTASPRVLLETLRRHLRPVRPPPPDRLMTALADLTSSIEQRTDTLLQETRALEEARDWWQRQAQDLSTQLRDATTYLREVEQARDRWQQQAQDLSTQLRDATAHLGEVEKARDWWQQQAQDLSTQLRDATAHLGEVEQARDWWQQQAQDTSTQLRDATAHLGEVEKARDWWQQRAEQKTAEKTPEGPDAAAGLNPECAASPRGSE
ncbi:hypothetical protein JRI60_20840 [Archangium violaceum]|uniref:hypothetical protein n=1 Tax=Archangium violaceum TaxID=83451 RepID=UPI00194F3BBE|nr:hypothetical protein [Archangium violaceum]QRO01295.1 hypothetical protein JRI60_20840 [Archangium violaceum]